MTVAVQRALGASWLQTDEARDQAHHELRHLGLPTALAHDLLAGAAYRLALELAERETPFPSDDPLTPAYRALDSAARAMLRARRTARPLPLPTLSDTGGVPIQTAGQPLDGARLRGDDEMTDRRRRVVSGLAVDRPRERSAALTALTLATEPRIQPTVDPIPALDSGEVGQLVWVGLRHAGCDEEPPGAAGPSSARRGDVTRRDRRTDAISAVELLLAEALATEEQATQDRASAAPVGAGPAANELVHRRAAHG